jgi:WD40 repeat protein
VQAYDIPTTELLPSQQPHPSPPNVLAISPNGSVLISASPTPPTIYIQDRRRGGSTPVNFHPMDDQTPVSCAAFQALDGPVQPSYTYFLLGFQDGKMVIYRLFLPGHLEYHDHSQSRHPHLFQLQPVRINVIRKLHKAAMGGVRASEFIPGHKMRAISIGYDGRCRLVDFRGGGQILRT